MPARQDVADLLDRVQVALTNATADPDLGAALATVGYDTDALAEGRALRAALEAAAAAQDREYGDQYAATEAAGATFEAARTGYVRHLRLARVVFEGDAGRAGTLALRGDRPDDRAALLDLARTFYTNALADADAQASLAGVGVDQAALDAGMAAVRAAEAARAAQQQEAGEAQQATQARDAALAALQAWWTRFARLATLATDGTPQLRERLGLLERS